MVGEEYSTYQGLASTVPYAAILGCEYRDNNEAGRR